MKIKDMPIEELELMSLTDLTYMILKENKKPMNTPSLFKEICELLDYSNSEYASKIGDYYTSLNIDKRFVLLDSNEWDIRDNHSVEIVIDEDEEETEEAPTEAHHETVEAAVKAESAKLEAAKKDAGSFKPLLWILAIAILAAVGVIIYHYKKR